MQLYSIYMTMAFGRPQYSKTCAAVPHVADIITNRLKQIGE